jgi:hypothetical protein
MIGKIPLPARAGARRLLVEYDESKTNKEDILAQMLYAIVKRVHPGNEIYRFPFVHTILGRIYHLNKNERYFFIGEMRREGLIKIVPFHGIKIINGEGRP